MRHQQVDGRPSAGLALMPLATVRAAALQFDWRCVALQGCTQRLAAGNISRISATPLSTVLRVPPVSWMSNTFSVSPSRRLLPASQALIWFDSHPRPTASTAEKSHGWRNWPSVALQHLQADAVAVHAAAGAMGQGHHTVDVRVIGQAPRGWFWRENWSAIARAAVASSRPTTTPA